MSTPLMMQAVTPEDIREQEPLPYDVFTAQGSLLLGKGERVQYPEQALILQRQGWKILKYGEAVPDDAVPQEVAIQKMQPVEMRLPARERLPVTEAEALLADDMPLMRQLLTRMLREQGIMKIYTADDGRDAVSHFFRYRPHLVFLDIDMPVINGLTALQQIKQWSPDNFVCMISGNSSLLNVKQAKAAGVDAFLVKPISPLNLQRVLAMYHPSAKIGPAS